MRIIIVGAGIVGAALADQLAPHASVTILDTHHRAGHGTTAGSLAWINANKTKDEQYFALRRIAMDAWHDLSERHGHPAWYRRSGNTTWAISPATAAELTERVARLKDADYPAQLITAADLSRIEPALAPPTDAVIAHFPHEAYLLGPEAVAALIDAAVQHGAQLRTSSHVVALTSHADKITGIRLASGAELAAEVTICAAGWRSPDLLATVGLTLPLVDARASGSPAPCLVATTSPVPGLLHGLLHTPQVYARPTADQGLLVEASDLDTATDLSTTQEQLDEGAAELLTRAQAVIPALAAAHISRGQRCVRPLPADGFPLVGWQRPGLYTAVTHSAMTLAPHLARLIAQEIINEDPSPELEPYRPNRHPR